MRKPFVLIDTDVLSGYFGRNRSTQDTVEAQFVEYLFILGEARVNGHVYQEILNGISKGQAGTYRKIRNRLRSIVHVPTGEEYETAVELSQKCTACGKVLSIADLMNCAVSISRGWEVLAFDGDHTGAAAVDSRVKLLKLV
ncbi:MAG: PIN domain-containing protein [Pontiellaceae bacterium]|nr:PIN domain-containing protein [Pontiellaceae bacterium]